VGQIRLLAQDSSRRHYRLGRGPSRAKEEEIELTLGRLRGDAHHAPFPIDRHEVPNARPPGRCAAENVSEPLFDLFGA